MDRAGEKLRRTRERLKLTYRDVEEASQQIAARRGSPEFLIPLSRLADIENGGKVPSLFRLYTLCAIYRLDFQRVLGWYGVPLDHLVTDALEIGLEQTHLLEIPVNGHLDSPPDVSDKAIDPNKTTFLGRDAQAWGAAFHFLNGGGSRQHRYGLIGLEDWSMFPILRPGSLVLIDESRRKIARGGWTNEFDRPIYFLEHRDGFLCGWCHLDGENLLVQPHPASQKSPRIFRYPTEADILGQIIGSTVLIDQKRRRQTRPATGPSDKSSN